VRKACEEKTFLGKKWMLKVVVEEFAITLRYNRRQPDEETELFLSITARLKASGDSAAELDILEGLYLAWHSSRSGACERGRIGDHWERELTQEDLRELQDQFFQHLESVAQRAGIGASERREHQRRIVEDRELIFLYPRN
jgi:hypothetical protein